MIVNKNIRNRWLHVKENHNMMCLLEPKFNSQDIPRLLQDSLLQVLFSVFLARMAEIPFHNFNLTSHMSSEIEGCQDVSVEPQIFQTRPLIFT